MVEAAAAQVDQQRAGGLPTVAAFARHRTSDSDGENLIGQHFRTATVGIQVRVPLYSGGGVAASTTQRSEEHTSELQSLMRISYAVFCLKKKIHIKTQTTPQFYKEKK